MAADKTTKPRSREGQLDDALEDSFPASDPVSATNPSTGVKSVPPDKKPEQKDKPAPSRRR